MNRSNIARKNRKIAAPAIAPFEDGVIVLKKSISPPVKWRYGVIIAIDELSDVESMLIVIEERRIECRWLGMSRGGDGLSRRTLGECSLRREANPCNRATAGPNDRDSRI